MEVTFLEVGSNYYENTNIDNIPQFIDKCKRWLLDNGWVLHSHLNPFNGYHKEVYTKGENISIIVLKGGFVFDANTGQQLTQTLNKELPIA